jgi:hypothetical protein
MRAGRPPLSVEKFAGIGAREGDGEVDRGREQRVVSAQERDGGESGRFMALLGPGGAVSPPGPARPPT